MEKAEVWQKSENGIPQYQRWQGKIPDLMKQKATPEKMLQTKSFQKTRLTLYL